MCIRDRDIYFNDWELKRVIDQLMDGTYANGDHNMYKNLYNSLLNTQCTDPVSYTHLDVYKRQLPEEHERAGG